MKIDDLPRIAKENRVYLKPNQTYITDQLMYGNNWTATAPYYMQKYPGFTETECRVLELWSNGMRAKEFKSLVKKQKKHVQHRKEE